ncbi:O-antigen ligase family protein [Bradyrhizobium sp. MOS003]|uniref:O-antigen ligase family protein n=1 Tax=Bradyrhizobium sp. MOS003 TaxID=2133946 RepID=UPI001314AB45|nr:O-antigen ligase family protein [Bradyrhizobium sp. MOS003]
MALSNIAPDPRAKVASGMVPQTTATIGLALLYLLFCLQHVVIGTAFEEGQGLSLGSTALRLVALGATVFFFVRERGIASRLRAPFVAIVACLCVLVISTALSDHRPIAVKFAVRYATQLLMLWCILNFLLLYPRLRGAVGRALIIALWVGLAVGLGNRYGIDWISRLSVLFHGSDALKYMPRIIGLYEHPATFGAVAVVVAVMASQLRTEGAIGKLDLAAAMTGAAATLILTEARNPIVPLLMLAAAFAVTRRGRQRWLALSALALLAGLIAATIWFRYEELTSASRESFATMFSLGRTYIWQGAFDAWTGRPWWGLGPGVFQFLTPDFTGGRFLRGELHAHNLVLGILSETGMMGFIAMTGLFMTLGWPALSARSGKARRRWALTWLVVLFGLGLFDFYLPFYGFSLHISVAAALVFCAPASEPGADHSTAGITGEAQS